MLQERDATIADYPVDVDDIRHFFPIIKSRQDGVIELNWLSPQQPMQRALCSSVDELLSVVKDNHQIRTTFYVGLNPRLPGLQSFGKNADIAEWNITLIDIDPVRSKGTDATDAQVESARKAMQWFVEHMLAIGCQNPPVIHSGNGFHVYLLRPSIVLLKNNRDQCVRQSEALFRKIVTAEVTEKMKEFNCRIDSTFDLRRIAKLPGTWSWKSDNTELWRRCHVISG